MPLMKPNTGEDNRFNSTPQSVLSTGSAPSKNVVTVTGKGTVHSITFSSYVGGSYYGSSVELILDGGSITIGYAATNATVSIPVNLSFKNSLVINYKTPGNEMGGSTVRTLYSLGY